MRRAFGDRAAGAVGWCFYFAIPVGAPPASMMAGGYVADVVGGGRTTTVVVAAALILGTGRDEPGRPAVLRAACSSASPTVLALLMTATMAVALPHGSTASLTPFAPNGWAAVGTAAAVLVWGFAGWEAVASLAGDYRDPRRDVPACHGRSPWSSSACSTSGSPTTSVLVLGPGDGPQPGAALGPHGHRRSASRPAS